MLRAIIVDDEYNGLRSLELLIKKFIPDIKVIAMTADPHEGVELINDYRPDIVFLDINMPSLNGFELVERLTYRNFHLIFTTAHQEHAVKAIKQAAEDYLLKPVDVDELKATVSRVLYKIENNSLQRDVQDTLREIVGVKNLKIPIPTKSAIEYVLPASIIYIEANSNTTKIFLTSLSIIEVNKSLKEYEQLLCKEGLYFMRIHNSFIVNLNYVTRYIREEGGQIVLHGNKIIPVSKHKRNDFFSALNIDKWV